MPANLARTYCGACAASTASSRSCAPSGTLSFVALSQLRNHNQSEFDFPYARRGQHAPWTATAGHPAGMSCRTRSCCRSSPVCSPLQPRPESTRATAIGVTKRHANAGAALSDLEPRQIPRLQLVSRKLQKLCLDDELWKRSCFNVSPWYAHLQSRRGANLAFLGLTSDGHDVQDVACSPEGPARTGPQSVPPTDDTKHRKWRKTQDMANWDPTFPTERVSWYDEYLQRYGPACISWLQTPRIRDREVEAIVESRGLALYNPEGGDDGDGTTLAVSPLDDGSVCLWDIKGTRGKQGSIIGRSKPDILFIDGPSGQNQRRSKRIDTGVTECVSVNHQNNRAFFAVQSREHPTCLRVNFCY